VKTNILKCRKNPILSNLWYMINNGIHNILFYFKKEANLN